MIVKSDFDVIARILDKFTVAEMVMEPRLSWCTETFALSQHGQIFHKFYKLLPTDWYNRDDLLFEVRRSSLIAGEYPSTKGWHDDHFTKDRTSEEEEHIVCIVGDIALPKYIRGELVLSDVKDNPYKVWDEEIDKQLDKVYVAQVEERSLVRIGRGDFHTSTPAEKPGTRLLLRASIGLNIRPMNYAIISPTK